MASTVISAFNEFMAETINLDPAQSDLAKASRDWLMDRIHDFPGKDSTFPKLYSEMDVFFGSFERKTKRRPLDDIDIMVCMGADGATYTESGDTAYITTTNEGSPLYRLRHDSGLILSSNRINSKRVVNKFVGALSDVPQYDKAEINRRSEAATLRLKSYDWVFDIVPCFHTQEDAEGKSYYLIPDGDGHWKKTDPTIDRARVQRLTRSRGAKMLGVIRLVKFWNCRPTMPTMGSYLLENMVLDYYENSECSDFPDLEFIKVIKYIEDAINNPVWDPKGIQGDLNTVGLFDRWSISARCGTDHAKCIDARNFEVEKDFKRSIMKWREVFGNSFPEYN
jgi:hypothetical protein